jgi:sterol desaturase/sphingolipid hydroxylase (fatty acid hydroxylase superfamily)
MNTIATVAGLGLAMLAVEARWPGRRFPEVPGFRLRAAAAIAVQAGCVWLAGSSWDRWLAAHRLFSAESLGVLPGALLGYFVITFVYYLWHRARHEVPFLWRWLHQVHHSPQRLEVLTSFYKHPLEIAANGVLSSAIVYLLVGLAPASASLAVLLTGVAELFYHWNVRTPHWLGYLVQRPESHCVHHQSGVHAYNYSDLPLWDWLFGTLRNPREFRGRCGFGAAEQRLPEMLRGLEVA